MNKKVVIVGGEGNGGVVAACIEDNRLRFNDLEWKVDGFVNDFDSQVCGYPVLGKLDAIPALLENHEYFFIWAIHMIGRNVLTEKMFKKANIPDNRLAKVIHKTAFVANNAILEPGVFVMSNAYIGPLAYIGKCSLILANALIGHNTKVAPLCHFSAGSITSSYVNIGLCSDVTLGAIVNDKKTIGNYAVAGAHSLITKDIPDYEIHVGSPAKFLRKVSFE